MFRLNASSEEDLLRRIQRFFPAPSHRVRVPIGDDAALVRLPARADLILTTDQMVEGVHFRRATHPPELLGARILTINLSDVTSMGAEPHWLLLSLFLPRDLPGSYLDGILQGMASEARRRELSLVGGNLSVAPYLSLDVTLAGTIPRGRRPLLRSGARPGDSVYVTGTLGGSALGLSLLTAGWRWRKGKAHRRGASLRRVSAATRALRQHLAPTPDYAFAALLARRRLASSAIDLSDGLSTDLWRLCRASRVSARVEAPRLPIDPALPVFRDPSHALSLALHGGEDYQLLFTIPPSREARLLRAMGKHRVKRIGSISAPPVKVFLEDERGRTCPLLPGGHDHFRGPDR